MREKPSHVPGTETYREKATRKFKENPWVPLGSLATVGTLVTAMVKMKRGESRSFNHWLRMRVVAQGLTIVAIVAGTYSLRPKDQIAPLSTADGTVSDPTLTRNDLDRERRRVEKMAREKEEFEDRLRDAEEVHNMEARMRVGRTRREAAAAAAEGMDATPSTTGKDGTGSRQGWLGWLGWGRSSTSSSSRPASSPADDVSKSSR